MQRHKGYCQGWKRRFALAGVLLGGLLFALPLGRPADAASKLYDMDRMLNAPHPFAVTPPIAQPPAQPPAQPRIQPRAQPGPQPGVSPARPAKEKSDNDPIEPLNRIFFEFNEILNAYLLGPLARGYNFALPGFMRDGISNFLKNLNGPVVLANDLLQFEFKRAYETSARLVVNSTAGVGGLIDVAERIGFKPHDEDFGQTLGAWGVGEGFYMVLPIFGPSNPRDGIGKLFVDSYLDPLGLWLDNTDRDELAWARTGVNGVVTYAGVVSDLDRMRETSVDFYGALRSLYRQKRAAEISNGTTSVNLPNFDVEMD